MGNRLLTALALVIALAVGLDIFYQDGDASLFLARKFLDLIKLVAFWR